MTTRAPRRGPARAVLVGLALSLAWLPAAGAWGEARSVGEDVCASPYDAAFDDIAGSAHEELVLCMADKGLTEGVGDGSRYAPRDDVTRGQMASFVARAVEHYTGEALPEGDPERFADVPADDASYPHATNIHALAAVAVVEGTSASDGAAYAPQDPVTRGQMATMIRRALAWVDDGDARDGSAPGQAAGGAFNDTVGSVHEDNIDAVAAVGIVEGFDDGTYRPGDDVKRDQMASFVMRSYDYAVTVALGVADEPAPPRLVSPATNAPAYPISPGEDVAVTFTTDEAGDYELEYRNPDPDPDSGVGFPLPGGDDDGDPGPWTALAGEEASGSVPGADTHEVTVTLPEGDDEEGVRDLRLVFEPDAETTLTHRQDAALIVGDGVVINLTQERIDFAIQDGADQAADGDVLLAVGDFEETAALANDDLLLAGVGADTVLQGSLVLDGVAGVTVSDMTVTAYDTPDAVLGLGGTPTGLTVGGDAGASDIALTALTLRGASPDGDDRGIVVAGDVDGVEITASTFLDNDIGIDLGAPGTIGGDSVLENNATGIRLAEPAHGSGVAESRFTANATAVHVQGADEVAIEDNALDEQSSGGIRLEEESLDATVTGNAFGDANAEHLRFTEADYNGQQEQAFLDTNSYASEPAVVDDGTWRIIQPPSAE